MTLTKEKKKVKKETFIQGILALMFSQVLIKIFGLIQTLYLTNREGFGDKGNSIYMNGYHIYALLLAISSIGVPNAIAKLISERLALGDNKGAQRIFRIAFATFAVIGFIGTLFLFFGANIIANNFLYVPEAEFTIKTLSPAIFFVSISSVMRGYFNGRQEMEATSKSQTFEQVFKTILTVVFVELAVFMTNQNTVVMATFATIATSLATILSFIYLFRFYKIARKEINVENEVGVLTEKGSVKTIVKKILGVSIPISISSILSSINKNIDSFTVVRLLKPKIGEKANELYGILSGKVDILTSMPLAFNIAFATALVPAISAARVKNDKETINNRISFSLLVTLLIGLPCTIGMLVYADGILNLLFPAESAGAMLLAISALTIFFTALAQTINGALQGLGKVKVPAIALGCGVIVKLIANLILIPIDGIYANGAAIGSVLCHIVSFSIVYYTLRKTVKLQFKLHRLMIRPVLATIIMMIFSYISYLLVINIASSIRLATIIAIIVAIIVYAISVILLKIFSKTDILMLPKGEKIYNLLVKLKIYA